MDSFQEMFDSTMWAVEGVPAAPQVLFAILLSFALNFMIAAVYKATYRGTRYSQDYVHTLLILGTVVTVIIMVVRGNAAVAFGIFAAFSIIRFRRSLPHARDVGFIFFSMATGMAVGAMQYSLAVLTSIVIATGIYLFSRFDVFAPKRVSHMLRIRVTNDIDYDNDFADCFEELLAQSELLSVETVQAGMMTELLYGVSLKNGATVGQLVEAVQSRNGNNRVLLTSTGATMDMG